MASFDDPTLCEADISKILNVIPPPICEDEVLNNPSGCEVIYEEEIIITSSNFNNNERALKGLQDCHGMVPELIDSGATDCMTSS